MNLRELVDHIRSGPTELVLDKPRRFRSRNCYNPCDFNQFLQALQSSETIRRVICKSQLLLSISEDQWVLLVKALGRIKDIQYLELCCKPGSRDFHPFQAVADAVKNAHSLCTLKVPVHLGSSAGDPSGPIALANALREHTALQKFSWSGSRRATLDLALDPVLQALPACPHLRKVSILTACDGAGALKNLLQLNYAIRLLLALEKECWLAVADEIRRGRCNVQRLTLVMMQGTISEATEAVQAIASAIQMDRNLEHLTLKMEDGFTDEAGVALAEALTVNKTLHEITLSTHARTSQHVTYRATLGAKAYDAFGAMLRVNTSIILKLPPVEPACADDETLRESRKQMLIEQRLNRVGRGRLMASSQTTRAEYVDALNDLNSYNVDKSPAFQVSCLYSLIRLHPSTCMS
jgi:hypothetical protein